MRRAAVVAALLVTTIFNGQLALAAVKHAKPVKPHAVKPHPAKNDSVALALDEVHTLVFNTPVSTVYVGNPTIADVTMIDAKHAFVQGKGYGRTNIMALNHDNVMVFNTHVTVTGSQSSGTVTLNRGSQRVTLNCVAGRCEQTPMPGDANDAFQNANSQTAAHQSNARGIAVAEMKN
jgi:Flp pilus assembly secretin CpaC